jgi:hypothetical protein
MINYVNPNYLKLGKNVYFNQEVPSSCTCALICALKIVQMAKVSPFQVTLRPILFLFRVYFYTWAQSYDF